jgi:hypothetical protein
LRHYVCAELARRGYIALLTPKNNPLFDVVATNQKGTHSVSIQAKTKAADNKQGWKLGKDMEQKHNNPELFVVLVALKDDGMPDFYVYRHDVLSDRVAQGYRQYLAKPKRDGEPRKELGFRWYDTNFLSAFGDRQNDWKIITEKLD